jgi:3-oxoacyl-[acyl-carrier protein] reductase
LSGEAVADDGGAEIVHSDTVREVAMGELDGKVALVTGASGGIGAEVARALHDEGASVGLLSRRGDDLGLERGLGVACDVRDRQAVADATEAVVERFGRLDVAVANAGIGAYGPFLELDPQKLEDMIDINLKGTLYTAAATLPHLIASGAGDFVSLASVAGLRGFPGEAVYNASKFGQLGFTRSLDHELREHGVRATNVCPGGVRTEFAIGSGREHGDAQLEGMMTAQDVAEVVRFAVTRPRHLRLLTTSFRPMSEPSWG